LRPVISFVGEKEKMVAFVATQAVDMTDLSELGLFSNFSQLKTPSVTNLSSFTATKGKVDMFVSGSHMTAVLKEPSSGTMDGVQVSVKGQLQYTVNNLGLNFAKTEKTFSGNFEKGLFQGSDVITGSGQNDKLYGYAGDDTITGRTGNDYVSGGKGNDSINGNAGNDNLFGDGGNDILNGGGGQDNLTGGGGKDTFFFNSKTTSANLATITDFKHGSDTIQLDSSVFKGLSKGALSSKSFIQSNKYDGEKNVVIYSKATGKLSYEGNGGTLKDAILFAKVSKGLSLDNGDFFVV